MIQFLPLASILVHENRQRKTFDEVKNQELIQSLQFSEVGLQNAIVIRKENSSYYLVSGERRLRACQDIYDLGGQLKYAGKLCPVGVIPCVDVGELSHIARMEAELEENLLRVDLTWQEKASATQALWELRKAQAQATSQPTPRMVDFVREISPQKSLNPANMGSAQDAVSKDLILSRHLDDPDIQAAKTASDAFKILKKKEVRRKSEAHAASIGLTFSSSSHTLENTDSLAWMAAQPPSQFDIILTDPPYGMDADQFGDSGLPASAGAHTYSDSSDVLHTIMETFPEESFRITTPDAHMYLFCDFDKFHFLRSRLEVAGWRVFRTPLIWYKPGAYRAPWPNKGPKRCYETILFATKGDREVTRMGEDVLTFPPDTNLGHHAQKPVALFTELLARSSRPGNSVLDPFCGSGTIFPAASPLKLYATGIELDSGFYGIASGRMGEGL